MIALTTFGPLRIIGGLFAFAMFVAAILRFRRRDISRASFLITSLLSVVIVVMAIDPRLFGPIFKALNFQKGNHNQLIAALLVAVFVLFALILRNMADTDVNRQGLRILVEALTLQSFDWSVTDEFPPGDRLVVVMPAHNEAENIGAVLTSMPQEVEGLRVVTLVVDDASEDETSIAAAKEGALLALLLFYDALVEQTVLLPGQALHRVFQAAAKLRGISGSFRASLRVLHERIAPGRPGDHLQRVAVIALELYLRQRQQPRGGAWIARDEHQIAFVCTVVRPLEVLGVHGLVVFVDAEERHVDVVTRIGEVVVVAAEESDLFFG